MRNSRLSSFARGFMVIVKGELGAWAILGFISLIIYLFTMLL
ncbi:MAG: hypothetical protein ACR2MX_03990 [Cyclobacteriaceae bacterium]